MSWRIELTTAAIKAFHKFPRNRQEQLEHAIDEMEIDPLAGDVKSLKGSEWKGWYRKRIGRYRIIFNLSHSEQKIEISAITIRSEKTYR